MPSISEAYRRRADEWEAAASRVPDPDIRATYLAIASRWCKMAEEQEEIETALRGRGGE